MKRMGISVAESLGRAHVTLLDDLRDLEEAVRPALREGLVDLPARLEATRVHITAHFRFEEQDGYMDAVRTQQPHLERTIQQLAEEHHQLAQSLDALLGEARTTASQYDALREQVRQWIEHVRAHEVRENDLVLDAFNRDVGTKD
jgi:hypothetical protein